MRNSTPKEYMRGIDTLRNAIVKVARKRPDVMRDWEYTASQSGLPRVSDFSIAQQQVAFREAQVILQGP